MENILPSESLVSDCQAMPSFAKPALSSQGPQMPRNLRMARQHGCIEVPARHYMCGVGGICDLSLAMDEGQINILKLTSIQH